MSQPARISFAVALILTALLSAAHVQGQVADPLYTEAKRLFDTLDYDNALKALDQTIIALEMRAAQDPVRRELLPSAYEMRARSKFGLGDQPGAKADFVALLKANAGYSLTGQVSPRVVTLYEEALKETVTSLTLSVTPATAKVDIDGTPITNPNGNVMVAVGDHIVTAEQFGYRKVQQPVTALADMPVEVSLSLERIASVLSILTVPADVEVTIDGTKRGKTLAGPPPASYADAIARAGVTAPQVSSVMVITDMQPGSHVVELTRDCYVRAEQRVPIEKPDDYTLGPIALQPAVANLSVQSNEPGAQVFIDGQPRGIAPFTLPDLCEGDHLVELRSAAGRYVKRVQARTGDKIAIAGTIKPAFALVSVTGQAAGAPDLRLVVERAFDPAQSVTFFAPPAAQTEQALKTNQLPAAWLAYDSNKRPIGGAADIVQPMRRDGSAKLAGAFGAQGVASVTVLDRNRVSLALLAAGSGEPDVLDVSLDSPDSIARAIAQLDRTPSFFRPSIGLTAVDVADIAGSVVINVDASGPAAKAGIRPGDIVVKANGQSLENGSALGTVLASLKGDDNLSLEIKDRTGASKPATVKVVMTPRLIGISDQTLLVNQILVALRARLLTQSDPTSEAVLRLNLAAALGHVEAWSDAQSELQRVKLPDAPGVANGTVQYLLGLAAEKLGNRAEAEAAFKLAAATDSLLTEDGPPVKELAEAKLSDQPRRPTGTP